MQVLIVHRDPEIAEQLVQMVKDYTSHDCDLAGSQVAAVDWGRRHARCGLLITQLEAEGFDGLALGGALSEIFPEPIDGDGLLEALARAEAAVTGAPDLFHAGDVLQMCCLSRRSGAIQTVKEKKSGIVFLRNGAIVHAETTAGRGKDALFEIVAWEYVEFAYDRTVRPPVETITVPWDEILIEAVERPKERTGAEEQRQRA